jgi:hypothetical protein
MPVLKKKKFLFSYSGALLLVDYYNFRLSGRLSSVSRERNKLEDALSFRRISRTKEFLLKFIVFSRQAIDFSVEFKERMQEANYFVVRQISITRWSILTLIILASFYQIELLHFFR